MSTKIDLGSILRDVGANPLADPNHLYVTFHANGMPVTLPVQVPAGMPQTFVDILTAAAPSINANHFSVQSLGIGLLTAYLQHQAMVQAATPTAAAPAASVKSVPAPLTQAVATTPVTTAPVVSAPVLDAGYVQDSGGFDGPSR